MPTPTRSPSPRCPATPGAPTTTGTSWDLPTLLVHQTSAVQTHCQPFRATPATGSSTTGRRPCTTTCAAWLVDQHGAPSAAPSPEQDGCVLPATGTYRLVSYLRTGTRADRPHLQAAGPPAVRSGRLPVVGPGAYGAAPAGASAASAAASSTSRPRAPTSSRPVDAAELSTVSGQLYDAAGLRRLLRHDLCDFAAPGRYTVVIVEPGGLGRSTTTSTTPLPPLPPWRRAAPGLRHRLPEAPHRGEFTAAGQYNCLQSVQPGRGPDRPAAARRRDRRGPAVRHRRRRHRGISCATRLLALRRRPAS